MIQRGIATSVRKALYALQSQGMHVSRYYSSFAAMLLVRADLQAMKWIYLIFFLIFELGSLLCATAQSSTMLIVGRAVAGMGGSGLLNGGLTIMAGAVPLAKRPGKSVISNIGPLKQLSPRWTNFLKLKNPWLTGNNTSGYGYLPRQ